MTDVIQQNLDETRRRGHAFEPTGTGYYCPKCKSVAPLDHPDAAKSIRGGECIPAVADWCRHKTLMELARDSGGLHMRRASTLACIKDGYGRSFVPQQRTELLCLSILLGEQDDAIRAGERLRALPDAGDCQAAVDLCVDFRRTALNTPM
ncbi:hypothetical protein [Myxococcus vastator]|uniref:hypothetical protein n=1 Tax=Myxococcus vastator TaxID=2709664 RepID=UPI0013CF7E0E|nr:hypothetical protein [Myxococcus vastator]